MTAGPPPPISVDELKAYALSLGFIACGIADLSPTPHGDVLDRWLAAGYGGVMRYINRQAKKRKDPRRIDPRGKSAVVVIDNYYYAESAPEHRFKIARYARGEDYHLVHHATVSSCCAEWLLAHGAAWARPFADAGPVPERELAQRAGLGWIGKNTMLLRPASAHGSLSVALSMTWRSRLTSRSRPITVVVALAASMPARPVPSSNHGSWTPPGASPTRPSSTAEPSRRTSPPAWTAGSSAATSVMRSAPGTCGLPLDSTMAASGPGDAVDLNDPDCFNRLSQESFDALFGDTALARPGLERMRRNTRTAASQGAAPLPSADLRHR